MKITQAFKEIKKPEDIASETLESYLKILYNDPSFTVKDASYVEDTEPQLVAGYKRRANILVDELIRISNNPKFEKLRIHFTSIASVGDTRTIIDEMKKTAETICFKLESNQVATPEKFKAEIKSATIDACSPGALTNMQKILYSMDNSLYIQKYNYIQNLANEYANEHHLSSYQGNEVHTANELIHEVSFDYNVIPPLDVYARYRNLEGAPKDGFVKQAEFKTYLDHYLTTREGVYSFTETIVSDYLSNLPDMPKDGKLPAKFNKQDSAQLEQVTTVADSLNIPITSIVEFSDNGAEFEYKSNYISIIKAATMQQLANEKMIEYNPLSIEENKTITTYEQPKRIKDENGKTKVVFDRVGTSKIIKTKQQIIESTDGWYLTEEIAGKTIPTEKLLDTNKLKELTINQLNIEDYLHDQLKDLLENGVSFRDAMRILIENNEHKVELTEPNLTQELLLLSDQAQFLKPLMTTERLLSLSNVYIQKWMEFLNTEESDRFAYSITHGDEFMLNKYLEMSGKTKQELITWKDKSGLGLLHLAAKAGNNAAIDVLIASGVEINAKNKDDNTALHLAVANNRIDAMAKLIEAGADLNAKDKDGYTALHWAVANNRIDAMAKLIEAEADINAKNGYGNTALHLAVAHNNIEAITKLVEAGADINAKNGYGNTALHLAAENNNIEAITKLIEAGADINAKNKDDHTALHLAVANNRIDAMAKLIEAEADINAKNGYGNTALHLAAANNRIDAMAKLIEAGADINAKNKGDDTALHGAVANNKIDAMAKLIEAGADVNAKNGYGNTALHLAAYKGKIEALTKLIEAEADINAKNKDGYTALHLAVANNRIDAMAKLIEAGADLNAKDKDGYTALHWAAESNNIEAITKLIEVEADVNAKNGYGNTALHLAAKNGKIEALTKLIEAGADVNAKNKDGDTALHLAAERGNIKAMAKLIEARVDVNAKDKDNSYTALHLAAKNGKIEALTKLIEAEADINAKNKDDNTALHLAVANNRIDAMAKLIEAGADLNAKDKDGYTALHWAAESNNIEAITKLIEVGADVNAKNGYGNTALHLAAERGRIDAMAKLVEAGADLNAKNKDGNTALYIVAQKGKIESIATSIITDKTNQTISGVITNLIKQASGYVRDSGEIWNLVEEIVKKSSEEHRIEIISETLKNVDNTSRRDRLLSFLPENERRLASAKVAPTMWQAIREATELMHGNSSVDIPDRTSIPQRNTRRIQR